MNLTYLEGDSFDKNVSLLIISKIFFFNFRNFNIFIKKELEGEVLNEDNLQ